MDEKLFLLIVDDEESILNMYEQVIDDRFFSIVKAESAETAIMLMKNMSFDVILSDLRMEGDSGLEILKYIKKNNLNTKFIMQTGYATVNTAVEAMKNGAFDFIQKPVNLNYLNALLERVRDRVLTERENVQLKNDNMRLEELNMMKEKFIAITNHEIRTPLTILKGYSDLVAMSLPSNLERSIVESMDIIRRTLSDLENITSRMHDLTAFNHAKIEPVRKPVELQQLVDQLCQQFSLICSERKQKLSYTASVTRCMIEVDPHQVKQAVSEIIQNAIKFTPDSGHITVDLSEVDDRYRLLIKDTGIGIKSHEIDKIFDLFYEVQDLMYHSSSAERFMGSSLGVGLALVKDICESNQIDYDIQSEFGTGTIFTFLFKSSG